MSFLYYVLSTHLWFRLSFLFTEQVGVCARTCEKECQFGIVLLPYHQPVGLQVALPAAGIVLCKQSGLWAERPVSLWGRYSAGSFPLASSSRTAVLSSSMSSPRLRHRSVSLRKVRVILTSYFIRQMPNDLNMSSADANFSTRPSRMSSCERS